MMGNATSFDAAFRDFLRVMLAGAPQIYQRCGRTTAQHLRDAFVDGSIDHYFEEMSQN